MRHTLNIARQLVRGRAAAPTRFPHARLSAAAGPGLSATPDKPAPVFSDSLKRYMTRHLLDDIDLLVCDMAGTTVEEGGLVYQVLRQSMNDDGLNVSEPDMHPWHGAKKEAVIAHFAKDHTPPHELEDRISKIGDIFLSKIDGAYFGDDSPIEPIDPSLKAFIGNLQAAGCQVAFDTGYPPEIQAGLIKKLRFESVVDAYISSYQVSQGRPYPYMIFNLMEKCNVLDVRRVAKAGDSARDIEEGRNAGCGLVIGVLSGADSAEELMEAGADIVIPMITDLPIPPPKIKRRKSYRIDLS